MGAHGLCVHRRPLLLHWGFRDTLPPWCADVLGTGAGGRVTFLGEASPTLSFPTYNMQATRGRTVSHTRYPYHEALSPSRTPAPGPRDPVMKPRPSPWHAKRLFDGSCLKATVHPRQASSTIRPLQGPVCLCIVLSLYEDLSPLVPQEDAQRTEL